MRGKGAAQMLIFQLLGITPAHAGKSVANDDDDDFEKDHPRACGEKQ